MLPCLRSLLFKVFGTEGNEGNKDIRWEGEIVVADRRANRLFRLNQVPCCSVLSAQFERFRPTLSARNRPKCRIASILCEISLYEPLED
jgi:hypothetical protein